MGGVGNKQGRTGYRTNREYGNRWKGRGLELTVNGMAPGRELAGTGRELAGQVGNKLVADWGLAVTRQGTD